MFLEGPKTLNGYSPVEDILSWRKGEVQDVVSMGGYDQSALLGAAYRKKKSTAVAFYSVLSCFFWSAPSGTRTQDPLIKSQLLYQLS